MSAVEETTRNAKLQNETPLPGAFTYSYDAYQTAGWHRADAPFAVGSETIAHDPTGTDMTVPKVLASLGTDDYHTIVGWLRNAVPGISAVEGRRAVRMAQGAYRAEEERKAERADKRRAVTLMERNGVAPDVNGPVPDAFPTRNHESVPTRSRKGVVSAKVGRRGNAAVIGGTHAVPPLDIEASTDDRAVLARTMATLELDAEHVRGPAGYTVYGARRILMGRVAQDVTAVADRCYGSLGLPKLEGTETKAFAQMVRIPAGGDPADCRVAVGTSYLTGLASDPTVDAFVADVSVYRAYTRREYRSVKHLPRMEIGTGSHRGLDARDTVADHATGIRCHTLIAGAVDVDHRWYGHTLLKRPEPNGKASTVAERDDATKRNEARNIGTVRVPETKAGWHELLADVKIGDRLTVTDETGDVVVTRGTKWNARDKRAGREHVWQSRTIDSLAIRLS